MARPTPATESVLGSGVLAVLGPTQYVATAIVAATYLLFVLVTRQQVMWSSYEALRAYIEGVCVAFDDARPELDRIFEKAGTQRWQRWPLGVPPVS